MFLWKKIDDYLTKKLNDKQLDIIAKVIYYSTCTFVLILFVSIVAYLTGLELQ